MSDDAAPTDRASFWGRFAPLIIFLGLAGIFGGYLIATNFFGYQRDALPSALIDKPAPITELPPLFAGGQGITEAALRAPGVKLVNVWASWCGPCRAEHPILMELQAEGLTILGMNHRDAPEQATAFLRDLGDPYSAIGVDRTGRASVEWGVYGVPETFVVDGEGRIVFKHVGPIQRRDLETRLRPAIEAAAAKGG
ncbi:DsbE family thiol:disulfide interchange protein [Rubrimonas sp.]|uniref:DsbE family thiol:disulfide interchange protein n=1 Tax=Rubrimonas sp. TaxID=2036015 RepID=UPI002FDDE223